MPSKFIHDYRTRSAKHLEQLISQLHKDKLAATSLIDAIDYSLLNGGKRIRALLCYAAALAIDEVNEATDTFATSLECIHAYSLVHDDLPAMDNDELRRGKPTCHIAFDEATAILVGDGLQTLAFELISTNLNIPPALAIEGCRVLARASGARGMVLGQALDLAAVNKELPLEELEQMHKYKTGALIEASVVLGALSAGANEVQKSVLRQFAGDIGLAFQVQDDIIDVTSDTQTLGKAQGADVSMNKPTYVTLLGLEGAKIKAQQLLEQSMDGLSCFGEKSKYLQELAQLIVCRNS